MEKAHLYEAPYLVNHGIDEAVRGVQRLKKSPKHFVETYHKSMACLERRRSIINLQFMFELREVEENDESYFEEEFNVWLSDEPLTNDEVCRLMREVEPQRKHEGKPPLVHFLTSRKRSKKIERKPRPSNPAAGRMVRQHRRTARKKDKPMNLQLLQGVIEMNQAFERVIHGLRRMEKVSFLQAAMVREDRAEVVLAQIDLNRLFFQDFYKDYERDEKWAADLPRACLAKRSDPEDDHIGVRQREEARKKKGLPPRVVFLPDWDMRDEQCYDETQTERRKKAAKKRHKKVVKPKPKRNQCPDDFTSRAETNAPRGKGAQS
jgi:hypothetical protein